MKSGSDYTCAGLHYDITDFHGALYSWTAIILSLGDKPGNEARLRVGMGNMSSGKRLINIVMFYIQCILYTINLKQ